MVDGMNSSGNPAPAEAPQRQRVTVTCYKAQALQGIEVPDLHLVARDEFPHTDAYGPMSEQMTDAMFRRDGAAIVQVLSSCLPGGTVDAILIELLDRKRTKLAVAAGGGA